MKGLSSTALAKQTNFAHASPPRSRVRSAISLMSSPVRRTASMFIPARVVATFRDEHMRSVEASASGMESTKTDSPRVKPLWMRAE